MTSNYSPEHEMKAVLADAAVLYQPRLFAIHGLYKRREHGHILGWGMQFPDGQGAVYTDPHNHTTHSAKTAERVLTRMRVFGDVELTWLTDEQDNFLDLVTDGDDPPADLTDNPTSD
jgi:hypothetical protein